MIVGDNVYDKKKLIIKYINDRLTKLEELGKYAFEGCINLPKITIPATIKLIDNYAFNNNINLTTVTFEDAIKISSIYIL